jgi:hypothetical protein
MENIFFDHKFNKIIEINPQKNKQDEIKEFFPQENYNNLKNLKLHKYGKGPFCKFKIPEIHSQGVYILLINKNPEYVGECEDLASRWNTGYANISPRACFEGGQSTNCRINNIIFNAIKSRKTVELFFKKLTDRFALEFELISKINPKLNKTIGKPALSNEMKIKSKKKNATVKKEKKNNKKIKKDYGKSNKFIKLTEYLKQSQDQITLDFEQLEKIIGFALPKSAFKYNAWWSNSGQRHSNAWTDAGYKVIKPKPGIQITFTKNY